MSEKTTITDDFRNNLKRFLDTLGLEEEPMGLYYTDKKPDTGFCPKRQVSVANKEESGGEINWLSCVLSQVRRARMEKSSAYFDAEHYGCLGGAFFIGFKDTYEEFETYLISSGIPGKMDGEQYVRSPEIGRRFYDTFNPPRATARYLVIKPLSLFKEDEQPETVTFFINNEVLSGLHALAVFMTDDIDAVQMPFGVGCCTLVSWPRRFLKEGKKRAVVGGFDALCRKYMRKDEVSYSISFELLLEMLQKWPESVLGTAFWGQVLKKIRKGKGVRKRITETENDSLQTA